MTQHPDSNFYNIWSYRLFVDYLSTKKSEVLKEFLENEFVKVESKRFQSNKFLRQAFGYKEIK